MSSMRDVARYAGVSTSTVSRVLNGHPHVDAEVRKRVLDAVSSLGFRRNHLARSMRTRRTATVAIIVRDMKNPNFTALCEAAEAEAYDRGYGLLLCNCGRDSAKERHYVDLMLQRRVDGLIVFVADENVNNLGPVLEQRIPVILVDSRVPGLDVDHLYSDVEQGMYAAVRHLLELGHRRVGLLAYAHTTSTGRARLAGYHRALRDFGIEPALEWIRYCGYDAAVAERETEHMLRSEPPTALIAASPHLTVGLLQAVGRLGVAIPGDLAVVGFDETEAARTHRPPLTVLRRPVDHIGRIAVETLIDRIEGKLTGPPVDIAVPFELWVRGSSAPPKGQG